MNGDFARITFAPERHFSRVLLQQGRMLLEADYNEQSAIHHHFLRTFIIDLVGRCWRVPGAFTLGAPAQKDDFSISPGHFYVDGILCENDAPGCTYGSQPFGPVPLAAQALPQDGFMAYVECWERHLSAVQFADLREIALAGRDTATRAQIAWQVRTASAEWVKATQEQLLAALSVRAKKAGDAAVTAQAQAAEAALAKAGAPFVTALGKIGAAGADAKNCAAATDWLALLDAAPPLLRARAKSPGVNLDPCAIAPDSQYRGRENQLYRVEIHAAGPVGEATLKWSRENASVAFRIVDDGVAADAGKVTVELEDLGHDRRTGLCEGNWVEITGDAFEFGEVAAALGQVTKVDRAARTVTLQVDPDDHTNFTSCTVLRRWDQSVNVNAAGTLDVVESGDGITLERGIQVQFVPGGLYRTGDYWLIPARVASGDIIWPQAAAGPRALPPNGIERHRAPIGFGKKAAGNWSYTPCGCDVKPLCAP